MEPSSIDRGTDRGSRMYERPNDLLRWLEQHRSTATETLRDLLLRPLATLMTVAAVAVALTLPAGLLVLLDNVKALGGDWQRSAAVALFLRPDIDEQAAKALAAELRQTPAVASALIISRSQGLAELRAQSHLGGAIELLEANPLPVVIELQLAPAGLEPTAMQPLLASIGARPEISFIREDARWIQRFEAIVGLIRTAVGLLSVLLGLGVLLVIGNTIRLEIQHRRDEIRVLCQVGATAGFARRPFLYSGAWYGFFGGLLAWLMVTSMVWALSRRAAELAALYQTELRLQGPDGVTMIALLCAGAGLGILGSWLAASRHIRLDTER